MSYWSPGVPSPVTATLYPLTTGSYDLGSSSARWRTLYLNTLDLVAAVTSVASFDSTIVTGSGVRVKTNGVDRLYFGTGQFIFGTFAVTDSAVLAAPGQALWFGAGNTPSWRIDPTTQDFLGRGTGAFGYSTGAGTGGAITQLTSKSTAVTLNTVTGQITMNNAALGAGASVVFLLNNNKLASTDLLVVNATTNTNYRVEVANVGTAAANIRVTNVTGGSLGEALVINFAVIKGSAT